MTKRIEWQEEVGSSLIEIIISILVISVVSMSLMHSFYQAEQATDLSGRRMIASNLAREIAEEWKKADFSELQTKVGATSSKTLELIDEVPKGPKSYFVNNNQYHSLVTISSVEGDTRLGDVSPYILRLNVTVFWVLDGWDDTATLEQKKALITRRTSSTVEAFITEEGIRR
jgi:Tfp pilus assembly protein PilV